MSTETSPSVKVLDPGRISNVLGKSCIECVVEANQVQSGSLT